MNAYTIPGDQSKRIAELHEELQEQCRLNGMGTEREAKLMAELEQERRAKAELFGALQMIAGEVPCIDTLMSDKDIARVALAKHSKEQA